IAAVLGTATPPTTPAQTSTPGAEAETAQTSRPARGVSATRFVTTEAVLLEDKLGMGVWFPQFVLGWLSDGRRAWGGFIRPLGPSSPWYQLFAVYQADPRSPLLFYVPRPQ